MKNQLLLIARAIIIAETLWKYYPSSAIRRCQSGVCKYHLISFNWLEAVCHDRRTHQNTIEIVTSRNKNDCIGYTI